ncbi:MAG: hypothetical protein V4454_03610 [Pseudomonadota bacterium]
MPVLVFLLILIGLWIFVAWDRKRLNSEKVTPLPRALMANGFTPAGAIAWKIWIGFGCIAASMALSEWLNPSRPPFAGRWSWIKRAAYDALGTQGLISVFIAMTCLALGVAFFLWRETKR